MVENQVEHGTVSRIEQCDGSLGWQIVWESRQVSVRLSTSVPVSEKCIGCDATKPLEEEPDIKWGWHKKMCEDPGNIQLLASNHSRFDTDHFESALIKCVGCEAKASMETERKKGFCGFCEPSGGW